MITKTYIVNKIECNILEISGKADHVLWKKANKLSDFSSPWNGDYIINTVEFKALWDSNFLFFCFIVQDNSVFVNTKNNSKESINTSDRVELFFRQNVKMNPYFCLEIDSMSRIMDFKAKPNKEFNFNWNWPINNIEIQSTIEKDYYIVEGAISINTLHQFNVLKKGKIETGIFNAKYIRNKEGDYNPKWITWVDPKTEKPNFHIADSFGIISLKD